MPARVPSGIPYVYVSRGSLIESVHAVAACAVDAAGAVALAHGDVDVPVFLRSAAKPFIAAEIVLSGAARRFELSAQELALIAASHNGEPFQVEAVQGILRKIGLDESALQCGVHAPSYEPAAAELAAAGRRPTALHNNCSGKHAGILAMCVHLGFDPQTYLEPAHPVERRVVSFCARMADEDPATVPIAIDGCGIPVYATSLRRAALSFARMATLEGIADADAAALRTVREAMSAQPRYVGGTQRFDTALIELTQGRIVGKAGAEGVHGNALLREGLGLVLKVIDGNRRATPPATVALLKELGALGAAELAGLRPFSEPAVYNVAGRAVGAVLAETPDTISGRVTS